LPPDRKGKNSDKLKKVIVVANTTWNIYNFRMGILRKLVREGTEVVVAAPVDTYIHYLQQLPSVRHLPLKHLSPQGKGLFKSLLLTWELFRIYRREQPDLILHFTIKPNIFGSIAAKWAGIRNIPTVTGLGYTFLHGKWLNKLTVQLYRYAFSGLETVVFHNRDDRDLFDRLGIVARHRGAVMNGSGVNTNYFRPLPKPQDNAPFTFLFIGRLLYDKGIKEYVEAAAHLREWGIQASCLVVGDLGSANPDAVPKEEFLSWIKAGYIEYQGAAADVRPFIKNCDALVLPSYREGMPRAILEALAMGKPIITTDVAGCREAICPKTGLLVPVKNSKALAEAMVHLHDKDREEVLEMCRAARTRALGHFDERLIVEAYVQLCYGPPLSEPVRTAETSELPAVELINAG
jgi:glycosyltransferase involved in cell wall biosynthesis